VIAATRAVSAVSSEARYVARAAWRSVGVVAVDRASKYAARAVDLAARYVALMAFSPSTYAFHCAWKAFHAEIEALFEVDVGAAVVVVEVVVVVSPYAAIAGTLTPRAVTAVSAASARNLLILMSAPFKNNLRVRKGRVRAM
jgi:hypothetical protein